VQFPAVARDFPFPGFRTHPSAFLIRAGGGGLSPGLKLPFHKANQPSLSGNEVLNEWSYSSTYPYAFMTCTETLLHLDVGSMLV
jgi:hypothetical protein